MENASLTINLNSLYNNAKYILNHTNGGAIAVVKNNAYNFGLSTALDTFYSAGVRAFATSSITEAIQIRTLYSDVKVILLNPCTNFDTIRKYNISATIANLQWMKENIQDMYDINWHLEWAGFMRRNGCTSEKEFLDALDFAKENNIYIEGIWTHFAWADEFDENHMYEKERQNWLNVLDKALEKYSFDFIHAQNSASFCRDSLLDRHTHVRCGILFYGCPGYEGWDGYKGNISHAINLSAEVINIHNLNDGESIGYSSSYTATPNCNLAQNLQLYYQNVAVINIGYGDGLLRKRVKGFEVLINSRRYPLVSMMMSHTVAIVDENVKIGDKVYFYGDDIPVYEFTYRGVGANSEQISALNHSSLEVNYIEVNSHIE